MVIAFLLCWAQASHFFWQIVPTENAQDKPDRNKHKVKLAPSLSLTEFYSPECQKGNNVAGMCNEASCCEPGSLKSDFHLL